MASVRRMLRNPLFFVVTLVMGWFIIAFLVMPNVSVLQAVFVDRTGSPSFRAVERLLDSHRAVDALRNSFLLAAVLSVTVNVLGIFIVLATRFYAIRGARLLWLGYATTLIYSGIVMVSGYRTVYGPTGVVTRIIRSVIPGLDPNWFTGAGAVIFVLTISSTGYHLLFLSTAMSRIDLQTVEAARLMGASDWRILRSVVMPVLKPIVYAITILTFLAGLSALAAPQILGRGDFATIAPMILTFANSPTSRDLAATLAIVLGLSTIALLTIFNRLERNGLYFSVSKVSAHLTKQPIHNRAANVAVHATAYLVFVVYVLPPALIVLYSFTDAKAINSGKISWGSVTFDNYLEVLTQERGYRPFLISMGYGAVTAVAVLIAMLVTARMIQRYRNPLTAAMEYLLHLPWILPSTMIALGMILTFDRPQPVVGWQVLTGTVALLAVAYISVKLPFTFRLLKAAFAGVPDNLEDAATLLGARPTYTFRKVLIPLVLPTAAAVSALTFNSLLDEYDLAAFLAHPIYQPLGMVIKQATSGETVTDETAHTFVYTTLLMLIAGLTMWLVYGRTGSRRPPPTATPNRERPRRAEPDPMEVL